MKLPLPHEDRITEQTGIDRCLWSRSFMGELALAVIRFARFETQFCNLVLKLGHALKFAYRGEAGKNPGKFGMSDDVGLYELVAFFGVESTGNVLGYAIKDVLSKGCRG